MKLWDTISNIGIKHDDGVDLLRQRKLNNQMGLFSVLVTVFFIPYLFLIQDTFFIPYQVATVILISATFLFNRFGYFTFSVFWRFFILILDISFSSLEIQGAGFEYFLIPLALISFILSDVKKIQFGLFFTALFLFMVVVTLREFYEPHAFLSLRAKVITFSIVMTIVFLLCGLFIYKFKRAGIAYEAIINSQLKTIGKKNQDITDSLNYAKRIQLALLPPRPLFESLSKDLFVLYKPKDIVSGDFYWIESVGNRVYVAVADCTGHGVPGAMMSLLCSNTLTKSVKELGIKEPARILDSIVELMDDQLSKHSGNINDGMDIALCCLDKSNNTIEFAGAHNSMYFIRDNKLNEIKADKQPIGKFIKRTPYTNHVIQLNKGDRFYLGSDGYADQFGGPKGKKFNSTRLKELFLKGNDQTMAQQKQMLLEQFDIWKGKLNQVDDVCILGFRIL